METTEPSKIQDSDPPYPVYTFAFSIRGYFGLLGENKGSDCGSMRVYWILGIVLSPFKADHRGIRGGPGLPFKVDYRGIRERPDLPFKVDYSGPGQPFN